ncbi:MAG: hypothetical protein NT121_22910, partial [Chloroflexi bacterium]|nr:hypothetical protein [Chloroflexota bacterium]
MRRLSNFAIKLATVNAAISLCLLLSGCGGAAATQAPSVTETVAETAAPIAQPTPVSAFPTPTLAVSDTFQATSDQTPAQSRLGQIQVEYPILLQPGASKTVNFSIYIPAELADASPESFKREVLSPDNPRQLGKYREYSALILVSKRMRVELLAPNFIVQEIYPADQDLDMGTTQARTNWGWTITGPAIPNEYVLVIKVFIANEKAPSWVGSFDVIVEPATPTPAPEPTITSTPNPTATPLSATDRFVQNIADNAVTLIGTLLTTIVALI